MRASAALKAMARLFASAWGRRYVRSWLYYGCVLWLYDGHCTHDGGPHQVPRFENTIMRHKSFNQKDKEVSTVLKNSRAAG